MCVFSKPPKLPAPQQIAAMDNAEAQQQAEIEDNLRRKRRGAAANVLTSPLGIPASPTMGSAA